MKKLLQRFVNWARSKFLPSALPLKGTFLWRGGYAHTYLAPEISMKHWKEYVNDCRKRGATHVPVCFWNHADGPHRYNPFADGKWFQGNPDSAFVKQADAKIKYAIKKKLGLSPLWLLDDLGPITKALGDTAAFLKACDFWLDRWGWAMGVHCLAIEPEEAWGAVLPAMNALASHLKNRGVKWIGAHGHPGSTKAIQSVPDATIWLPQLRSPWGDVSDTQMRTLCQQMSDTASRLGKPWIAYEYDITGQQDRGKIAFEYGARGYFNG